MTLVIALAGVLLADLAAGDFAAHTTYARTADSSIEYAENGTAPVAAFVAHDQDGDPIRWSLSGADHALFTIAGGTLAFRQPPDYEEPLSGTVGNVYRVTIEASGGTHEVEVTVVDVDEAGSVSIDRPQPQVSRPLRAILSDEDAGVATERWQWARSQDRTTWTDIRGATSPRRSPEPSDAGMFLRATVTYSDRFGANKTASAVTANRVEARTLSNAAPSFVDPFGDEVTTLARRVAENSPLGSPVGQSVSAADTDGDILFYELLETPDLEDGDGNARFVIDSGSGQIRVGKILGADARDHLDDPDEREDEDSTSLSVSPPLPAGEPGNGEYVLRVRASDPSTASATVNVIVTVTDVNEPPEFDEDAPTVLRVIEDSDPAITSGEDGSPVDAETFAATDQDADDVIVRYQVIGDDSEYFEPSGDSLSFAEGHEPDYEEKGSYSIAIKAISGKGVRELSVVLDVTVEVVDARDVGEVTLSQREPQEGAEVHATLDDPDGGVRVRPWLWWRRSAEITVDTDGTQSADCPYEADMPPTIDDGWTPIDGADSSVYIPVGGDVGMCLSATAFYSDGMGDDERASGLTEAPVQASSPTNAAPQFLEGSGRTSRRVAENTEADRSIGSPVTAFDDDEDLLIYTLGGADAGLFGVTRSNGQLLTKAPLNYEVRSRYTVRLIATDPSGASDSMLVTVHVTDENDPARITGIGSVEFPENGTGPVAAFRALDEDRGAVTWSVSGRDADRFTIGRGVLRFREPPDYEDTRSAPAGNVYRVIVEAGGNSREVAVTVTDVDEAGAVTIDRPQPQVSRPLQAVLSDEDAGVTNERWQWSRSRDGTTWTDIEGATSRRRSPAPSDVGMYLRATVTYTDKFGAGKTASAVSARPVEPMTLANAAPSLLGQDDDEDTPYIDVSRSISENSAVGSPVGRPVSAIDEDSDILFYELLETPDLRDGDDRARFTIDSLTGQLRLGKTLGADDAQGDLPTQREDEDSGNLSGDPQLRENEDAGNAENSEYVLRVRVSDPSTASATVNVIVTVTDVNEPPEFDGDAPAVLRVVENASPPDMTFGDGDDPLGSGAYAVIDEDGASTGPGSYDDTSYKYSLSGAHHTFFTIDGAGTLAFRAGHIPDFEVRRSYSITVTARSGEGARGLSTSLDLTVEVVDADDPGEVDLSQRQPEVGIPIHATVSDEDGGVTIRSWVWERSNEVAVAACREYQGLWESIRGVSSAVYAPRAADLGRCLRATALYSDELADERRAIGVAEVTVGRHDTDGAPEPDGGFVNAAPAFPDQDHLTEGDQSETTSRTVPENTETGRNIGSPVSAVDDDGDLLIYTLGGADAAFFRIARNDGQLKTRAALNYEARNAYTVVVTATDPFGAADSIVVAIEVTDEDDPTVITVLRAGSSQGGGS